MDSLNRNYRPAYVTEVDLVRNAIIAESKKTLLQRPFAPDPHPIAIVNSAKAFVEGFKGSLQSLFGMPVWDIIKFRYINKDFLLPLTATLNITQVEVSQNREIIETRVAGMDGKIKEYISDDDFHIKINSLIVSNAPDYYPEEEIKSLMDICAVKDSVEIYSTVLNDVFNINNVVIKSYTIKQPEKGMRNVQEVEIDCVSDNPELYKIIMSV